MKEMKLLTITAAFAALIALSAALLHIPVGHGYVHCGDALVYLAGFCLPFPYAQAAAAIGGAGADLLGGYAIYAIPSAIIKALNALCFFRSRKDSATLLLLRGIASGAVTVAGYYLTDVLLYGSPQAMLVESALPNLIQAGASLLIFAFCVTAVKKTGLTNYIEQ